MYACACVRRCTYRGRFLTSWRFEIYILEKAVSWNRRNFQPWKMAPSIWSYEHKMSSTPFFHYTDKKKVLWNGLFFTLSFCGLISLKEKGCFVVFKSKSLNMYSFMCRLLSFHLTFYVKSSLFDYFILMFHVSKMQCHHGARSLQVAKWLQTQVKLFLLCYLP